MLAPDPEAARASWRYRVGTYDAFRHTTSWPGVSRLQEFVRRVADSEYAARYFTTQSMGRLGLTPFPDYARQRAAPTLWVGHTPDGIGFELCDRDARVVKTRSAPTADALRVLGEMLADLDALPGA